MILQRILRRRPDAKTTEALILILAQRSVTARAAADHQLVSGQFQWPPRSRVRAVLELDEPLLNHLIVTQIDGPIAGGGRIRVLGVHLLIVRAALPAEWAGGWSAVIHAHPSDAPSGLGPPRDFEWLPSDASMSQAAAVAAKLGANDRVQRRVLGVLREPSTMQFEIDVDGSVVRISVQQSGREVPDPTAVEALLAVARAILA